MEAAFHLQAGAAARVRAKLSVTLTANGSYSLIYIPSQKASELGGGWSILAAWQTEQYWILPFSSHRDLKPENILLDDHGRLGSHRYRVEWGEVGSGPPD